MVTRSWRANFLDRSAGMTAAWTRNVLLGRDLPMAADQPPARIYERLCDGGRSAVVLNSRRRRPALLPAAASWLHYGRR